MGGSSSLIHQVTNKRPGGEDITRQYTRLGPPVCYRLTRPGVMSFTTKPVGVVAGGDNPGLKIALTWL